MKSNKIVLVLAFLCFSITGLETVVGNGQAPDFARLDDQLHALIKDKSTPDPTLLEAISRLGKISEPPAFWTQIANDSTYSIQHRRRAVFALFRRHAEKIGELHLLGEFLESAKWLQESPVEELPFVIGWVPVDVNLDESIFTISVLGGWKIYMRVVGDVEESTVREVLSGKEVKDLNMELIVMQYGYGDDYDQWLRSSDERSRQISSLDAEAITFEIEQLERALEGEDEKSKEMWKLLYATIPRTALPGIRARAREAKSEIMSAEDALSARALFLRSELKAAIAENNVLSRAMLPEPAIPPNP